MVFLIGNEQVLNSTLLLKDKTIINEDYKEVSRIKKDVFENVGVVMSIWFQEFVREEKEKV